MITPRMCLTHWTGFANFWFIEPDQKLRIHFEPGSRYSYSAEGFILLQFAIGHGRTGALVGAGVLQARIYTRQKGINARQLEIGMNDQRGWIKAVQKMERAKPDDIDSWAAENAPVSALVQFTNTGKTPINEVQAKMAVRIIERTPNPFSYERSVELGAISPMMSQSLCQLTPWNRPSAKPENGKRHPVSHYEYTELVEGRAYAVTYLEATYCDIFAYPML